MPCEKCSTDRHQSLWRLQSVTRVGCCLSVTLICARGQHERTWQSSSEYPDRSLVINRLVPVILYSTGMAHEDAFIMLKSLGMNANREKYSETVNWSQEIILEAAQLKMKENRQRLIDFIKYQDDHGNIEAGHLISSIAIGVDVQYNRSHRPPPHGVAPYATAIFLLHGVHSIDGIKDLEGQVRNYHFDYPYEPKFF